MGPSFVHVCNFGISDPCDIARVSPKNFSLFLFCVDLPERDSAGPIIALLARSGRALTWKPLHSFFLSGSVDGKDCAHLFTRSLEKASAVVVWRSQVLFCDPFFAYYWSALIMTLTNLKRKEKVDQSRIKKQSVKNFRQFQSVISLQEEEEMDRYFFNCFQKLYSTIKK